MNASQQAALAERFDRLLKDAGIKLQRSVMVGGQLDRWEDVPVEGIIGRWLQNGWRIVTIDKDTEITERRIYEVCERVVQLHR